MARKSKLKKYLIRADYSEAVRGRGNSIEKFRVTAETKRKALLKAVRKLPWIEVEDVPDFDKLDDDTYYIDGWGEIFIILIK